MKSKIITILAVLIVVAAIVVYVVSSEKNTPSRAPVLNDVSPHIETNAAPQSVGDEKLQESVALPRGFILKKPMNEFVAFSDFSQSDREKYGTYEGVCSYSRFAETKLCYVGTTTVSGIGGASIGVSYSTTTSQGDCEALVKTEIETSGPPVTVTIDGIKYSMASTGEASAGHYLHGEVYQAFQDKVCHTITLNIESHAPATVGPGTVGSPEFYAAEDALMKKLRTFIPNIQFAI